MKALARFLAVALSFSLAACTKSKVEPPDTVHVATVGKIKGLNEWHDEMAKAAATDYAKPVSGLKTPDEYTLQMTLKEPSVQILYALAMTYTFVVPREGVDKYGKEFINHAIGTGPFRLE